jgi:capsular polysaccharide transport system ATP-binding protein
MLALHDVSKVVGHGVRRRLVLDNISWEIPPRAKIAILGHVGSGKSELLALLSGAEVPTTGWVERRAVVLPTFAFLRHGRGPTTPRQLIRRLSPLFRYDPEELSTFVSSIANLRRDMDIPISKLTPGVRSKLNVALTYGVPCDFYLFNKRISFGPPEMRGAARKAFELRCEHAGVILATNIVKEARDLGGAGAVLHRGKIVLFDDVEEAIELFARIKPDDPIVERDQGEDPDDEPDFEF